MFLDCAYPFPYKYTNNNNNTSNNNSGSNTTTTNSNSSSMKYLKHKFSALAAFENDLRNSLKISITWVLLSEILIKLVWGVTQASILSKSSPKNSNAFRQGLEPVKRNLTFSRTYFSIALNFCTSSINVFNSLTS